MDSPYIYPVKFDMMRVREDGWIVPRHNSGMLRAVRGVLRVEEVRIPNLNRHSRVAKFTTESGEVITMMDVVLLNATQNRIILSGFERNFVRTKDIDFAQTWVLVECQGTEASPTMGPPFDT